MGAAKNIQERSRLTAAERRAEIIRVAVPLFASQGFRGVTTKMLAKQAGISEALLYQHFSSKEEIYEEVQDHYCKPPPKLKLAIESMEPGSEMLVTLFYCMTRIILDKPAALLPNPIVPRLMLHSLTEDGAFAQIFIRKTFEDVLPKIDQSVRVARQNGDLVDDAIPDKLRFWLTHHVAVGLNIFLMPETPILDYGMQPTEDLLDCTLRFMFRGLGLTDGAVAKYYDKTLLDQFMKDLMESEEADES